MDFRLFKQKMRFTQCSAWKEALWIFVLSRLIFLLLWYPSITVLPLIMHIRGTGVCVNNFRCFLLSWSHWDTFHYLRIAHDGYASHIDDTSYFPFYPLLMRIIGFFWGGSMYADYAAALIISNICFYSSLILFFHIVRQDFDSRTARYACLFLALAPYAFFFFIGYTESLFFFLTLAVFFFLRRGSTLDWWLAGLCGFLAALTRPTGFILVIPFIVLFIQQLVTVIHKNIAARGEGDGRAIAFWAINRILAMAIVPAGLLVYFLYLWKYLGNPWLFMIEQRTIWHHYTTFPWVSIWSTLQEIASQNAYFLGDISDLLFTMIPLVALIIGWKRLPLHYSLFSLTMIIFVLCTPRQETPLFSVPRYILIIFPIYILFALWSKSRAVFWNILLISLLFFIILIIKSAVSTWIV